MRLPLLLILALEPETHTGIGVEVESEACPELDGERLRELLLLELELAEPQPELELEIRLRCTADEARVELSDPLTDKIVIRSTPLPSAEDEGRERVLALAISRLVVASWLELLLDEEPGLAAVEGETVERARAQAAAAIELEGPAADEQAAIESTAVEGAEVVEGLSLAYVARDLAGRSLPTVTTAFDLGGWWPLGFGCGGRLSYAQGKLALGADEVHLSALGAGLVAGWRYRPVGALGPSFRASSLLELEWHHLRGDPSDTQAPRASYYGLGASAGLEVEVGLRFERVTLGLTGRLGYGFAGPRALAGDTVITARGLLAGAGVRVGIAP